MIDNSDENYYHVISESEFVFGSHNLLDGTTKLALLDFCNDLLSTIVGAVIPADDPIQYVFKINTMLCGIMLTGEIPDFCCIVSDMFDEAKSQTLEAFSMSWANDLFGIGESLDDLAEVFSDKPTIYKQVFEHCASDTNYGVFVKFKNGEVYNIADVGAILN